MCILVANEPRAYRDVIAATLRCLCPHAEVIAVEPTELEAELVRLTPQVVVHSQPSEVVQTRALAWALLYPDGEDRATLSLAGRQETIPHIEFADLLTLIDRAASWPATANDVAGDREFDAGEVR